MLNLKSDIDFCMPCGVIQHLPFPEQVDTMKKLGFTEFTIHQHWIGIYNMQGHSLKDMKSMVEDAGLRINRIDPLCTWVPKWQATKFGHEFNLQHAMEVSEFLELSAFFDCKYTTLNAMWDHDTYSEDEVVEFYRQICDRAAKYGVTCDLEAIPMWGIPHIDDAKRIIDKSGVDNGGLVFDSTHIVRGGTTMETVKSLPPELIHLVQLCDGKVPAEISLEDECFDRMWAGNGDFPIGEHVATLASMGALRSVGPETFSPDYAEKGISGDWIAEQTEKSLRLYPELLEDAA